MEILVRPHIGSIINSVLHKIVELQGSGRKRLLREKEHHKHLFPEEKWSRWIGLLDASRQLLALKAKTKPGFDFGCQFEQTVFNLGAICFQCNNMI